MVKKYPVMLTIAERVAAYIRAHSLMHAGDRVAVAVSGGADSVGLLRMLLDLRGELGLVISVVHFHHGIRGADADADEVFVRELARTHDLQFHIGHGQAPTFAATKKVSLEAAARQLRHQFFCKVLEETNINRIATAHTMDDQSETVLMKVARGAGTRGLSGIFPEHPLATGSIVRPLLEVRREQLREYLRALSQEWREDKTNADCSFTRNRVRERVLPLLREDLNPSIDLALAHLADMAQAEEQYWDGQIARLLPLLVLPGEPARGGGRKQTGVQGISVDIEKLQQQPLALRRRLVRAAAQQLGCNMDFEQVRAVLELMHRRAQRGMENKIVELGNDWVARLLFRELRFESAKRPKSAAAYELRLPVPGQIYVAELGTTIRVRICESNGSDENASYNRAHSIRLPALSELVVRNWRPGDRFRPARHTSEKRVKELLYPLHLAAEEKQLWPVVAAGDRIVWVRSIDSPELRTDAGQRLSIEESIG